MKLFCATPMASSSTTVTVTATTTTTKLSSLAFSSSSSNSRCLTARTTRKLALVSGTRRQQPRRPGRVQCLFGLGVPELVVIAGVAALVFGPKKLPEIGRSIGKTVKSFQEAAKEFETELKKEPGETAESSSTEQPKATTSESNKEIKASGTKETV